MRILANGCTIFQSHFTITGQELTMSEGHIYVSYWQRTERGYEGWIERWPKRRVSGGTFYEMREALGNVVGEEVGDGEPNFEFEPPFIEAAGWEHLFRD